MQEFQLSELEGFERHLAPPGSYTELNGPIYYKAESNGDVLYAIQIDDKHLNASGITHGGALAALADTALGLNISKRRNVPHAQVTVSMSVDFMDVVKKGDWVIASVDIQRMGARMAFATCFLTVKAKRVLRASSVFALL